MTAAAGLLPGPGPAEALRSRYVDAMSDSASGVAIVTTMVPGAPPAGLTATSTASVSADPPVVSLSLVAGGRSLQAIQERREFVVNMLHAAGQSAARAFATSGTSKFDEVSWELTSGGLPWLPRISAHSLVCQVIDEVPVADHVLLLGLVRSVLTPDRSARPRALVYRCRRFWELPDAAGPTTQEGST